MQNSANLKIDTRKELAKIAGITLSMPAEKAKVNTRDLYLPAGKSSVDTRKEMAKAAGIECSLAGRQGQRTDLQHPQLIAEVKGKSRDIDLTPSEKYALGVAIEGSLAGRQGRPSEEKAQDFAPLGKSRDIAAKAANDRHRTSPKIWLPKFGDRKRG